MPFNYIGLATSAHDPALAIVNSDGEVVFAEATERYLQNKRAWCNTPEDIIRVRKLLDQYCDPKADLVIATTWTKRSIYYYKMIFNNPLTKYLFKLVDVESEQTKLNHFLSMLVSALNPHAGDTIAFQKSVINPKAKIYKKSYNHHLTHAAAACYSSPFNEGVCAIIDGIGEGISTSFYTYKNGEIIPLKRKTKSRTASLGFLYSHLCDICGFSHIKGEEWKVMGLAAYGKYDEHAYNIFKLFLAVKDGELVNGKNPKLGFKLLNDLRLQPGENPLKAADLAYTVQLFFCDIVLEIINNLYQKKISENLILGGGCMLNSSCNGIILQNTPFKNLHVYSAPADDGNAIGAALLAYYDDHARQAPARLLTPYLGERMQPKTLQHLNKYSGLKQLTVSADQVPQTTAELLAQGKIIGWVQGRAEFGPRALGNRSILADPRSPEIKEQLNANVKFREEFRPFAPSILHEHGPDYFEHYQESPYMERTLRFKPEQRAKVPGVVHVDGTGRLQTVKAEWNKKYYDLISCFYQLTGIPLILNTSFNIMGKPIIHTVEDALSVFLTSGLDVLVIEDQIYLKQN